MGEQQINTSKPLDTTELDKVTGGVVVHERRGTTTTDARRQEQGDKLTASEHAAK